MNFEVLPGVAGLEEEWWDLWWRDPTACEFQSPAWLVSWRRQFCEGADRILTIRRERRLMALLPLSTFENRLIPWGAGTSDRLDGIFDPDLDASHISRALAELAQPLDLFQVHLGSPLLEAPLPDGWTERRGPGEPCVELPLPADLPRNMAQNLRYYRRRADKAGAEEPERVEPDAFDNLVELHGRRWRGRGETGVLSDPRVLAWHR